MTIKFEMATTEYGVELSVTDTENADQFDDFLVEQCDITTAYMKPIKDGMIFGFGKSYSTEQVQFLIEQFNRASL